VNPEVAEWLHSPEGEEWSRRRPVPHAEPPVMQYAITLDVPPDESGEVEATVDHPSGEQSHWAAPSVLAVLACIADSLRGKP